MKRIVITGIGLVTSIGDGVDATWKNLISCKSGIRKISSFETEDLPCKIAGHISNNSKENNFFDEGKYFRIPVDDRDLDYNKYFDLGQKNIDNLEDYTSANTIQLNKKELIGLFVTNNLLID